MLRWRHRPSKGVCGDAGEGGVINSDGAGADDGDGGREAVIVLCVADVVKVCALVSLPVVDEYVRDVVAEDYDITSDVDRAEVRFDGTDFVERSGVA